MIADADRLNAYDDPVGLPGAHRVRRLISGR